MIPEKQLQMLSDKAELTDLLIRYFASIDERHFEMDIIENTFTPDAKILRPNGSETSGHREILNTNRTSFARFKATQHSSCDHLIDLSDNQAKIRANLTGMHLWADSTDHPQLNNTYFYAGIVLHAMALRNDAGWRIRELRYVNVWRNGEGLAEMAKLLRPKDGSH